MLSKLWEWLFTDPQRPLVAVYRILVLLILGAMVLLWAAVRSDLLATHRDVREIPTVVATVVSDSP